MTTGRPREFDQEKALSRAMDLFWRKGYEATSMSELVEHTGVCRQSLYNVFGDKKELFKKAIQHYRRQIQQDLLDCLKAPGRGMERIREAFDLIVEGFCGPKCPGCLVTQTAVDLAGTDKEIRDLVCCWVKELEQAFQSALDRAIAEGDLDPEKNPEILASFLVSNIQGLIVMGKAGTEKKDLRRIVETTLSAL